MAERRYDAVVFDLLTALIDSWTLAAWCEMRNDFRNFRLDRINDATLGERFEEEPGRTLRDMLSQYGPAAVKLLD